MKAAAYLAFSASSRQVNPELCRALLRLSSTSHQSSPLVPLSSRGRSPSRRQHANETEILRTLRRLAGVACICCLRERSPCPLCSPPNDLAPGENENSQSEPSIKPGGNDTRGEYQH